MKASLKSQKRNRTTYIDTSLNSRTMTVFEFIPSFFAWSFSLRFLEFAVFQGSFCIASNLYILYGHLRLLRLATCNSSSTSELTNWDPSAPSRSVASRNCASCLWTGGGLWRRSEIWWTFDGHFACGFRVFRYSLLKEKSERKVIKWLFWWFFFVYFCSGLPQTENVCTDVLFYQDILLSGRHVPRHRSCLVKDVYAGDG